MPLRRFWRVTLLCVVVLGALGVSMALLLPSFRGPFVSFVSAFQAIQKPERETANLTETPGGDDVSDAGALGDSGPKESDDQAHWPFRTAKDGHWVSYEVRHESKGQATGGGPLSVRQRSLGSPLAPLGADIEINSRLNLLAYVLSTKTHILIVPQDFEADVRTAQGDALFQRRTDVSLRAKLPPLSSSVVRQAFVKHGLLAFQKPPEGLGFEAAKALFLKPEEAQGLAPTAASPAWVGNLLADGVRALAVKLPARAPSNETVPHSPSGSPPALQFEVLENESDGGVGLTPVSYVTQERGLHSWILNRSISGVESKQGGLRSRVSSQARIEVATRPLHVVSFQGERTKVLWQDGQPPLATNHYTWRARREGNGVLGESALLEVELLVREALGRSREARLSSRAPNLERQMHKETLAGDSLQSLLSDLTALAENKDTDESAKTSLYLKIKALLVLEPEAAQELIARAQAAPAGSTELQLLAGALSSAGTPEAQAALREVHESAGRGSQKSLELVPLLGMAENPTAGTLLYLEELSRAGASPESKSALLSLGIAAHKGQSNEGELARRIALSLRERLMAARTLQDIIDSLVAGGNTGDRAFLRAASGYVGHAHPSVRSSAILALRFVPFEEFEGFYEQALSDREERVRESALLALKHQESRPELARFLIKAFPFQGSSRMRVGLLNLLWSSRKESPEVQKFVQEVASDPSLADVQRLASRLISEGM